MRVTSLSLCCLAVLLSSARADRGAERCKLTYTPQEAFGEGWPASRRVSTPPLVFENMDLGAKWQDVSLNCGTGAKAFWQVELHPSRRTSHQKLPAQAQSAFPAPSEERIAAQWSQAHWQRKLTRGEQVWALIDTEGSPRENTVLYQCAGNLHQVDKEHITCGQAHPYFTARLLWPKGETGRACHFAASVKVDGRWISAADTIVDCLPSTPEVRGQQLIKRAFEFQHMVNWLVTPPLPGDGLE